jgi:hypothetical protein
MATAPSAPAASQSAPGGQAQQGKGQKAPQTVPFRCGTQNTTNLDGYSQTVALSAATVPQIPNYNPSVNSYLRGCWITAVATTSGNAATVAFLPDAPYSLFAQISFLDTQQRPIVQVTGFQLAMIRKWGGYFLQGDPAMDGTYVATTGGGGTGGSFAFTLWVPLEINNRTGMGAALNKNSAQTFTLQFTLALSTAIYSTAPTTLPSATITVLEDGWWQPAATDVSGAPLAQGPSAPNTWSYWLQGTFSNLNGATQVQLPTGLGESIRQIQFYSYDVSATNRVTGDTDFPTTVELLYKGTILKNIPKSLWKTFMSMHYGYTAVNAGTATTTDTPNSVNNGVYVLWQFAQDFGLRPGDGQNYALLNTDQGDQFQFVGTFNAAANLLELVNYVATVGSPAVLRTPR